MDAAIDWNPGFHAVAGTASLKRMAATAFLAAGATAPCDYCLTTNPIASMRRLGDRDRPGRASPHYSSPAVRTQPGFASTARFSGTI